MKKIDIDYIKKNCRYLQIDLPFRGEEDELYSFEPLLPDEEEYIPPFVNQELERWVITIDLKNKKALDWKSEYGALILNAKVRDEGIYTLLDNNKCIICIKKGYVPNGVVPPKNGWCDYIRMVVQNDGTIDDIYDEFDFTEFAEEGYLPCEEQETDHSIPTNNMLIYTTADGKHSVEVNLKNETLWLSLDEIATLFDRNKSTISRHIKNIFDSGELDPDPTVANFATVQKEGARKVERAIVYYNLDMIISIGYRVNSLRGTHFRMWATATLKEYIIKGEARKYQKRGKKKYL